jgi:hypothetical protein
MIERGQAIWDQDKDKRLAIEDKVIYDYSSKI